jgi:hypothetical protein
MNTETLPFPAAARRVNYKDGILLAASDFQQEQIYHRARLAAALCRLHGFGTVAGLKVERFEAGSIRPEDGTPREEEELLVNPGFALDRQGRVIEIPRPYCLRLQRWFEQETARVPETFNAFRNGTKRYLLADIFLGYTECPNGLRPSFPEPAADATDAVIAARIQEGFSLSFLSRDCDPETDAPPLPGPRFEDQPTNYRALLDAVYASYNAEGAFEYPPDFEDTAAVFLSRVLVRLADPPATDLARHPSGEVIIQDEGRPIVVPTDLLRILLPPAP